MHSEPNPVSPKSTNWKLPVAAGLVAIVGITYWSVRSTEPAPPAHPAERAFAEGAVVPVGDSVLKLRHERIDAVSFPSGQVAIYDPVSKTRYPITADVAGGNYPVLLTIAEGWNPDELEQGVGTQSDERLAFATLQFEPTPPTQWITAGYDKPLAIDGDSPMFIDNGCFEAFENKEDDPFWAQVIESYQESLVFKWAVARVTLEEADECQCLFLYTEGVGGMPWLGTDATGRVVCLTVDYGILPVEESAR